MPPRLKTALCIVAPVVIIGLLVWTTKDNDDDAKVYEKSTAEPSKAVAETTAAEQPPASAAVEKGLVELATSSQPAPPKPRIEIKSSPGRGRGLFLANRKGQEAVAAGQVVALVRPALILLFEPFCYTHCLGCFADLHEVSPEGHYQRYWLTIFPSSYFLLVYACLCFGGHVHFVSIYFRCQGGAAANASGLRSASSATKTTGSSSGTRAASAGAGRPCRPTSGGKNGAMASNARSAL